MTERLDVDTFRPHVGTTFWLALEDGALELVLFEVTEPGGDEPRAAELPPQFSLYFRGPPHPILSQRIYHLDHDELGGLDLFLVPISTGAEGTVYEAAFA
jgi:hypothetical protein